MYFTELRTVEDIDAMSGKLNVVDILVVDISTNMDRWIV
jgi:hypothetical protein